MKIVFFGSDDFALVILEALSKFPHEVIACVTQPDKPKGRGLKINVSVIKECALKNQIPLLQPSRLKAPQLIKQLKDYRSDLFVVVAYGRILPPELLVLPYLCAMNVHASLLPRYRGAAPINWAIINGEKETGISIIKMNAEMDAGDIFAQAKIPIDPQDTAITLRSKLAVLGADFLLKTIDSLEKNAYTLAGQDHCKATTIPKLTKNMGLISWDKPAISIHNLVRGLVPWPTAYTYYQGRMLKILETEVVDIKESGRDSAGKVVDLSKDGFVVATGDPGQGLLVKKVHLESANPMPAAQFLAGRRLSVGLKLGE